MGNQKWFCDPSVTDDTKAIVWNCDKGPLELELNSLARAWTGRIDLSQEMGFSKTLWNGFKGIFSKHILTRRGSKKVKLTSQVKIFASQWKRMFLYTVIWKRNRLLNTPNSGYWVSFSTTTFEHVYQRRGCHRRLHHKEEEFYRRLASQCGERDRFLNRECRCWVGCHLMQH